MFEMFQQEKFKKIVMIVAVIVILSAAVLSILSFFGILKLPSRTGFFGFEKEVIDERPTARNAFDIALIEAQKWQPDAKLAFMNSGTVGESGRSNVWKLIFTSANVKGKGYIVEVSDYKIISATEIKYVSAGAEFPADVISPEEAIKSVRRIKGYENVEIFGVEAVYMGKLWYWGVKTSKGTVSVKTKIN